MTLIAFLCAQLFYTVSPDPSALLRGKGRGETRIIPDGCITLRDKVVDWSLGAFLLKRHTSADKLTLGIGIVDEELEPVISISKKAKGMVENLLILS